MRNQVETLTAILPSAGYNYNKATRHTYSHSEVATLPAATAGLMLTGVAHMFKCEETGELRRWGFDVSIPKDN